MLLQETPRLCRPGPSRPPRLHLSASSRSLVLQSRLPLRLLQGLERRLGPLHAGLSRVSLYLGLGYPLGCLGLDLRRMAMDQRDLLLSCGCSLGHELAVVLDVRGVLLR